MTVELLKHLVHISQIILSQQVLKNTRYIYFSIAFVRRPSSNDLKQGWVMSGSLAI